MCTLAHIFEAAGLSSVVLTPMRDIAERMRVPRALYTAFPVGRPLGKPRDKTFQSEVLKAAFCLLEAPKGPIISEFPERISSDDAEPLLCSLPPRVNTNVHPAVDDAACIALEMLSCATCWLSLRSILWCLLTWDHALPFLQALFLPPAC